MSYTLNFFASCPKGLELLLADELRYLGANKAAEKLAGVEFTSDLATAYKACLWSRLANRILLKVKEFQSSTPEELYAGIQSIAWDKHVNPAGTLSVNFVSTQSQITHTLYGAQKVKDAIVDQLRDKFGVRPNVARDHANVVIHVYLYRDKASVSIDLSGESLHKRGYRLMGGSAPLKENLAAAVLLRAKWPDILKANGALLDPMCGSGTLLIEGAMLAADCAPGLLRDYFGFLGWKQHDPAIWQLLLDEAKQRRIVGMKTLPKMVGYDEDPHAIKIAFENIERAGLRGKVHVEKRSLDSLESIATTGLVVINPPYGERLGEESELQFLYTSIGDKFKKEFVGWKGAVFTGNPELGKQMGIRAIKYYSLFNGSIPCQLLLFDIIPEKFIDRSITTQNARRVEAAKESVKEVQSEAVQMFANRVRKNIKNKTRWINKENISCYRLYDADLPEYAFSIDMYEKWVHVKEYPAPKTIDKEKAGQRQQEVLAILPELLSVPSENIFFQRHYKRLTLGQANIVVNLNDFQSIHEGQSTFLINLIHNEFEMGFSLEQRQLRSRIMEKTKNSHFLSLFDSAGVMSVCATVGGAKTTKTIVQSEQELNWVKANFNLNNVIGKAHQLIHADAGIWLDRERSKYNVIFADLSVVEEDEGLLYKILKLLLPEGILIATSYTKTFSMNTELLSEFSIEDISQYVAAPDFTRQSKLKYIWKIS